MLNETLKHKAYRVAAMLLLPKRKFVKVDITIDGCDEADDNLTLIKVKELIFLCQRYIEDKYVLPHISQPHWV